MTTLPAPIVSDLPAEVAALARRQARAAGPVVALMTRLGGRIEDQLALVPDPVRQGVERAVAGALSAAWEAAGRAPRPARRAPMAAAVMAGAAGGAGGLPTALAEVPVTVTLLMAAIRAEAEAQGFDPADPAIRAEGLRVFTQGGPFEGDEGIDTSFLSARLTITGPALHGLIATVAPKLAAALGQKLAAQAVPVLGAAAGAALNAAFLSCYRELAAVRFGLMRLAVLHGPEPVARAYAEAARRAPLLQAR
jgi:hypothetical protein